MHRLRADPEQKDPLTNPSTQPAQVFDFRAPMPGTLSSKQDQFTVLLAGVVEIKILSTESMTELEVV